MAELKDQSSYMGNARQQLFIMDSCYGGLLAVMRDSVVDPHVPHYLQVVTNRLARQVLTAGGEGQEVVDGGPKGHSVFMDALLEGLQDGLADLNGDGYITFHELVAYVTPRASNDYQTPGDGVLPGHQEGEFLFVNPKGSGRPVSEIPLPADAQRRSALSVATAEQHLALGNSRWPVGDWDGAIAQYREAIRLNPDYAEAHTGLGMALHRKRDWDGAIREEREAIRLNPDLAEAHAELGSAFAWKGDSDGTIREEREAIRLNPDLAEAHALLGSALARKGDWDGDIREEREAIRLKPDVEGAHAELGSAFVWKGDWDGAIREEREAIRLKPDLAEAHEGLGIALEQKGDRQSALAEYRRALELKPDYAEAKRRYDELLKKKN
jgi:tetratricopeptide (TPR) repeat protein